MLRIAFEKEDGVGIVFATGRNGLQLRAKSLRMREPHQAFSRIVLRVEPFHCHLVKQSLYFERRGGVEPGKEFTPEYRQEAIGPKARCQQHPETACRWKRAPQGIHTRHPRAR